MLFVKIFGWEYFYIIIMEGVIWIVYEENWIWEMILIIVKMFKIVGNR